MKDENFKPYRIMDAEGKLLIPSNIEEWGRWFESGKGRHIGKDQIGEVLVSTVCLGVDHGWNGKPLWFETMIFGGPRDNYQERYETREEALEGHKRAVALVKGTTK